MDNPRRSRTARGPKFPHTAIIRAPGLFCMQYGLQELSESLDVPVGTLRDWIAAGLPHQQDRTGAKRIWIVGTDLADWMTAIRHARSKHGRRMADDEAYCMKCRRRVEMLGPFRDQLDGERLDRAGHCTQCGSEIHRSFAHKDGQPVLKSAPVTASPSERVQGRRPVSRENFLLVEAYLQQRLSSNYSPKTCSRYASYLRHLLLWVGEHPLCAAHTREPDFFEYLEIARQDGSAGPLAHATQKKIIGLAHEFFLWLKTEHPRQTRRLPIAWIHRIRSSRSKSLGPRPSGAAAVATATASERAAVTEAEIQAIAQLIIPQEELTLRRDQAAACFLYASGMRAGAFSTMPIAAFDLATLKVAQLSSLGVETKNGKNAVTTLLPIPALMGVIRRWDEFVRGQLPEHAMWFTPIRGHWGNLQLTADKPGRSRHTQLRKALRNVYAHAGLPYRHPHAHRHGHATFGLQHSSSLADYKAVSQNLMHADLFTTDRTYAVFASEDVHHRIHDLLNPARISTSNGRAAEEHPAGGELANAQVMAQLALLGKELQEIKHHMRLGDQG
jgi:integrase